MSDLKSFRDAVDQYAYIDGSPLTGRAAALNKPDPKQAAQKRAGKTYTPPATDAPTQQPAPDMGINKATGKPRVASKEPKPAPLQLSPQQDMEEQLAEIEADEAEARWEQIPEDPGNLEDDALHEAETAKFSDAVTAKLKELQERGDKKPTTQAPPIEQQAWDPVKEAVNPANYAQELHAKGEQLGEDSQLATAGVYEGSPQQLQQFAKMLGLEMWGVISTPEQLHGAIEYAGPAARARLVQILQHNGLTIAEPQQQDPAATASQRAGSAVGDFITGFKQTSPIGLARTAMRSVGRGLAGPVGDAVARNITRRDRNQAVDKYEPGYEPMQVNAIPPPKAEPRPSPRAFTARTNDPNADFWITRRGSMETVGRPHKEFAPESIGITVNKEHLDPTYAYYMMQHLHGQGHWKQHATGTTNLVNIRTKHLKQLADQLTPEPEPLPPVEGPIPPLPKEKPAEQSYGEKEVAKIKEATQEPEQFAGEAEEKPGIVMPSDDVINEDASEGDQLGLFGEGKKKKVPKQYKQDNPQGKARAKALFDKDEDPDQQTLFSSWGEAVEYYSMQKKK